MSYFEDEQDLKEFLRSRSISDPEAITSEIAAFGDYHSLTLNQIGLLCSLIKKIFNKEADKNIFLSEFTNISDELESTDAYHLSADAELLVEKIGKELSPLTTPMAGEETLKSIPDIRPETQEIAPKVTVETSKAPINLVAPPAQIPVPALVPQERSASPTSLAPTAPAPENIPVTQKATSIIAAKLNEVTTASNKNSAYPGGRDPYREEI